MRKGTVAAAMVAAMALNARAEPASKIPGALDLPLEGITTRPDWAERQSGDQVAEVFPKLAQMLRLDGRAELQCVAEPNGSVDRCSPVNETPPGLGFAAAAAKLAPFFKMRPATVDGRAIENRVNIPIRFMMADEGTPRPEALSPPTATDPAKLALAREVLDLSKSVDSTKKGWRRWVDSMVTSAIAAGQTQPSPQVLDALQVSADQVAAAMVDRGAYVLAAQSTLDQLGAIRSFYQSAAGQALVSFQASETMAVDEHWANRIAWTARDVLCGKITCLGSASK